MNVLQKGISKIQKIHRKTLKVIYHSNNTYEELLELSETVSIRQRHLRFLVTEVYKSTSYLNSNFMCSFFTHKEIPYNLRKGQVLHYLLQDRHITKLSALPGISNLQQFIYLHKIQQISL